MTVIGVLALTVTVRADVKRGCFVPMAAVGDHASVLLLHQSVRALHTLVNKTKNESVHALSLEPGQPVSHELSRRC